MEPLKPPEKDNEDHIIAKKILPDTVGVVAGSAAITALAIAESPVIAVVAAGIGVWWLVRTTIKAISGS
jgi:hypothetical protein